ncbi:hypothetical protein [Haloechinothrix sp. LS1_15]|uniref:hypothetical protein n=1 Tax=Haloechinothrix sp. LS1_15 TaxID=2652248 RepID=UPI0029485F16|nr:hypothetical protein [Haloechinothrix sp. LS1_15]MDV6012020.1 hypothetical protein [Haloechinothrix sp. LS1_15]
MTGSVPVATTAPKQRSPLNHRERALLRAVALGRAELTVSCEPDLFIDGLACCDQSTAHRLARHGYINPRTAGPTGIRAPAVLTERGEHALAQARAER